jgi:hypothetical protein
VSTVEVEAAPVVVRDVFPAVVTAGPSELRGCRVVVTRARVYVWQAEGGRPALRSSHEWQPEGSVLPSRTAGRGLPTVLALPGGDVLTVRRQAGCGCGNPLKAAPLSVLLPGATRGVL